MSMFRYVAITRDGKKVTGQITAVTEDKARKELHRLGFSVLTINVAEAGAGDVKAGMQMFDFEGFDKEGKAVRGTIEGSDYLPVYRRLVEEYKFEINYLCKKDAEEAERQKMRNEGMRELEDLYHRSKGEGEAKRSLFDLVKIKLKGISALAREDAEQQKKKEEKRKELFLKEIDNALQKARDFLEQHGGKLSQEAQAQVRMKVDDLLRVRNSKNEHNIKTIADELLSLIKKDKEELQLSVEDDEDALNLSKLEALSDEETQRSDETSQDYVARLGQLYEGYSKESLRQSILRDLKRLVLAHKRKETWRRLILKFKIFIKKYKAERAKRKIEEVLQAKQAGKVKLALDFGKYNWVFAEVHRLIGLMLFLYLFYFVFAGVLATKDVGFDTTFFRRTLQASLLKEIVVVCFVLYASGVVFKELNKFFNSGVRLASYWLGIAVFLLFTFVNI